jgi:hypothetical protein
MSDIQDIITKSEDFDKDKKYNDTFQLLEKAHKDFPEEAEITWRLARVYPGYRCDERCDHRMIYAYVYKLFQSF